MKAEKQIKIKDHEYTVKFPLAGQFMDIEALKIELSHGRYGQMLNVGTVESIFALDMIDMESYFTVLFPDKLKKDLNVNSLRELSMEDATELTKAFRDQLLPFIQEVRKIINDSYSNKEDN